MAHNALASYKFITNAPVLWITTNPSIYASYPTFSYLRVNIDGVNSYYQFVDTNYIEIGIGKGGINKTIEITEPGTTKPSTTILGCFITSIKIPDGFFYSVIDTDTPAIKKLFIGNSITVGANSTYLLNGFAIKFRDAGDNISVHGWGYGSITLLAGTAGLRTTLVSQIDNLMDGTSANELIIMLGTNDYAVDKPLLVDFQANYDALLQAINTARPDIVIKCVSPIVRTSEGANSNGDTLPDFRTAISNACSGKAYCEYIDGSALITTGDLADGVHPDDDGHTALYNALVTAGV
jgi:lysophospholipase L1-like esterase